MNLYDNAEPKALQYTRVHNRDLLLYSIAISLKRIADSLEGNNQRTGIQDTIADIAQGIASR
jgi:hypothetical protein